jgi:transcriptional regulator GlxA family with amidase domain
LHSEFENMTATNSKLRRMSATLHRQQRVIVLVVPPVEELDLVGPIQVLSAANRLAGKPIYSVEVATNGEDLKIEGEGGLLSLAHGHYAALKPGFDSLLLVCGLATRNARDRELFAWMRSVAPRVHRLGSVCVGSFLLAEAGLLNGRRATTHWKFGQELSNRYPKVRVVHEPIWVRDGNIYTSAGISAGIDLALAWVEEDCGNAIASEVARELVLFLRRPGGQAQLSVSLAAQAKEMKSIQELQVWIAENLRQQLSLPILADRVACFHAQVAKDPTQLSPPSAVVNAFRMTKARFTEHEARDTSEKPAYFEEELPVIVISNAPTEEHRPEQRLEQNSDGCILRYLCSVRRLTVGLPCFVHRKQIYVLL